MEIEEGKDIPVRVIAAISFVVFVLVGAGCVSKGSNRPIQLTADEEIYVVQPNDSIKKIANAYGVPIPILRAKNSLKKEGLRVGQKLKVPKKKYTLDDVFAKAKSAPLKPSFLLPTEEERPIAPLSRVYLVGKWQCHSTTAQKEWFTSWNEIRSYETNYVLDTVYDFKPDGTYSAEQKVNGRNRSWTGTWRIDGEMLLFTFANSAERRESCLIWLSADKMRFKLDDKEGENLVVKTLWGTNRQRLYGNDGYVDAHYSHDRFGMLHVSASISYADKMGGSHVERIESQEHFVRVSVPKELPKASYEIVSCEREASNGFMYRFVLNLTGKKNMQTFRAVQKEFRQAVKEDYVESFPGVNKDSLFVEFSEYKLNNDKIEGRAVVLTISVVSLTYDPNTRTGKLAVKVNANQYEEARKWIRKNIETLARDKNIALVTGEIPPAAKFYLGREELKDGNVLEIEFRTE